MPASSRSIKPTAVVASIREKIAPDHPDLVDVGELQLDAELHVRRVLAEFGLDRFYSDDPLPVNAPSAA